MAHPIRSSGSIASYTSVRSSDYSRTPRASYPSEATSVDSARGSDCNPDIECFYPNDPRASLHTFATATYASTISEDMDVTEFAGAAAVAADEILPAERPATSANVVASSPKDFAELFPSSRRMLIRHDDTTIDGNMNLRVDTPVKTTSGQLKDMTLFHVRMHDLKRRDFSLRRYCRDSGREICHSSRKPEPVSGRKKHVKGAASSGAAAGFMRLNLRSNSNTQKNSDSLKRQDSGYESDNNNDEHNNTNNNANNDKTVRKSTTIITQSPTNTVSSPSTQLTPPPSTNLSNDIHLEFSNYARFALHYGNRDDRRYTFEYYGIAYSWSKHTIYPSTSPMASSSTPQTPSTRYTLTRTLSPDHALAHVDPLPLTPDESRSEIEKGGWIPPCAMWISDRTIISGAGDVADVVVITGLVALVDDTVRGRFEGGIVLGDPRSAGTRADGRKGSWRERLGCM